MRPSLPIEVFAVAEGKLVAGILFFGIVDHNLEHYEQKWLPELLKRRREAPKLRAERLRGTLQPVTRRSVAALVRSMNRCDSNL